MTSLEKIQQSIKPFILGADEVGYGPLAGPVVVCGVRAPKDWKLEGLNDSKKLSEKKRDVMRAKLLSLSEKNEIQFHIAERDNKHIDKYGVAVSLKDAYVECFKQLYTADCLIISDGILKFDNLGVDAYDKVSLVKADTQIPAVMAASILAKTYRDGKMKIYSQSYNQYDWESNMGYGSKTHLAAIHKYGPSPFHRMSYAPMKNMVLPDPRQVTIEEYLTDK
jgi:ribonuclease HII